MIKRLEIENFMAHKDTVLELDPGVTILTGPNNTGKSAVVEAFRCLVMNQPFRQAIRHGASRAVVRVELEDGEIIEWDRTATRTLYRRRRPPQNDGESPEAGQDTYAKFGRNVPEDIRNALRIRPVETETGTVDVHIGNQRYPIFLLDQTGSQAAAFFAASTEAEYLLRMQQALKNRTDEQKRRRKACAQRLEEHQAALKRYAPLEEIGERLRSTERLYSELQQWAQALPLLTAAIDRLKRVLHRARVNKRKARVLATLRAVPEPAPTPALDRLCGALNDTGLRLRAACQCAACLEDLRIPPIPEDTRLLRERIRQMASIDQALEFNRRRQLSCHDLRRPPTLHRIREPHRLCRQMRSLLEMLPLLNEKATALELLSPPPPLEETPALEKLIARLHRLQAQEARLHEVAVTSEGLKPPPRPHDLAALERMVAAMGRRRVELRRLKTALTTLRRLPKVPLPQPVTGLQDLLSRRRELDKEMQAWREEARQLAIRVESKRREIETALEQAGFCPLCRQPMSIGHFLGDAHD